MSKFYEAIGKGIGGFATLCISLFFARLVSLAFLWLGGWILQIVCGHYVAQGLNLVFNTTRFAADQLPMLSVALGFVGNFFIRTHEHEKEIITQPQRIESHETV